MTRNMSNTMPANMPKNITQNLIKILMIEDDIEMAQIIKHGLEQTVCCSVRIASDPFEAMNLMSDYFYDFIILDWQLPFLNGNETIETADRSFKLEPSLPAQWDTGKVPVIILSASAEKQCHLEKTNHFKYSGHISKKQPLINILFSLAQIIENENGQLSKSA